jgi:prepilin-type N-terminal cleavage/methylation domain-containing protein
MTMKRSNRGFTLIELMIVVGIIAIIAGIAIPSLLRSKMTANHGGAGAALKALVTQEATWRALDIDRNGVSDYWVEDVRAFYGAKDNSGSFARLIDMAFANADLAAGKTYGYSGEVASPGVPRQGYKFRAIASYLTNANSVAPGTGANGSPNLATTGKCDTASFGFTSVPETYNTGGTLQFIVNQEGVIWQRDCGNNTPQATFPAGPADTTQTGGAWSQFGG